MSKNKKKNNNKKNAISFEMHNAEGVSWSENEDLKKEGVKKSEELVPNEEKKDEPLIEIDSGTLSDGEKIASPKDALPKVEKARNKKIDLYIEYALILILGILMGVAIKTEAIKRVTIGFNDYQMKIMRQDFDINKIQFEITKKDMESANNQAEESSGEPPIDSQTEE